MKISFKNRKAYPSGPSTVLSIPPQILDSITENYGDLSNIRFLLEYDGEKLVYNIIRLDIVANNEQPQAL